MKLSRRSFFGLIPGAALGGKAAIKEAAAKAAEGMALAVPGGGYPPMGLAGSTNDKSWAVKALQRLVDPDTFMERKRELVVTRFDPDLASNHSMSLSVKMLVQRERDFERYREREKTYLERTISGYFD